MAMLITGGRDAMRNHMYGAISQDTANFIQSQIASLTATYGDVAAGFQNQLMSNFNASAMRSITLAKNNLDSTGNMFDEGVRKLTTVDDFRMTSLNNQHYICSNPYFLREFTSGRMEGWKLERTYPELTGGRDPYFQNVMQGAVQYGDEDWGNEDSEDVIIQYYNDEVEELPELMINEKFIIKQNWNTLYNLIQSNSSDEEDYDSIIDPTSIDGNFL